MDAPAVLIVILRWTHAVAAALWVGGGVLYLALRALPEDGSARIGGADLGRTVGNVLRIGIGVFVLTGGVLTAARLTGPEVGALYVGLLALKILLAVTMFGLAMPRPRRARGERPRGPLWRERPVWIVGLGLVVYLISLGLDELIEASLRGLG